MNNLIPICPSCGKNLDNYQKNKKCCSTKCKKKYYQMYPQEHIETKTPIRSFVCKKCKKLIYVYDFTDKRTQFCNILCEKRWFKHSHKNNQSK